MQKKHLFGTALLAASTWTSLAVADNAQQQAQQQQQGSRHRGWSLAELKAKCAEAEGNSQILPFVSHFECSVTRDAWKAIGEQKFVLPNEMNVSFMSEFKNDKHKSDWYQLPMTSTDQWGTCTVYEKVLMTQKYSVTLESCAALNEIVDEQAFCAEKVSAGWSECQADLDAVRTNGSLELPTNSRCFFEKTSEVKSCGAGEVLPSKSQCQQGQHQQGQQQQCAKSVYADQLGSDIRTVEVRKNWVHNHHRAISIENEVLPGSILADLGLNKGCVVSRINGYRTRTTGDFVEALRESNGKVKKMEYRNPKGTWVSVKNRSFNL